MRFQRRLYETSLVIFKTVIALAAPINLAFFCQSKSDFLKGKDKIQPEVKLSKLKRFFGVINGSSFLGEPGVGLG